MAYRSLSYLFFVIFFASLVLWMNKDVFIKMMHTDKYNNYNFTQLGPHVFGQ